MGFLGSLARGGRACAAAGRALADQLWPQWQGGLQDAQTLFTRMTLDQPPLASVPGQGGVSTQKELYDLAHPEPTVWGSQAAGKATSYGEFEATRQQASKEAPAKEQAKGRELGD